MTTRDVEREFDEVAAALDAIRAAVRERAGYTLGEPPPALQDISPTVEAAERARITGHVVLSSQVPLLGPVVVLVQRTLRLLLRWYVNPIIDQQNNFNDTVVRVLFDFETRQRALERRLYGQLSAPSAGQDEPPT